MVNVIAVKKGITNALEFYALKTPATFWILIYIYNVY